MPEPVCVWLAQCVCPQRHAILATAGEAANRAAATEKVLSPLQARVAEMLRDGVLKPRCSLCGSPPDSWVYELGRTRFGSLQAAMPALRQSEREQAAIRNLWGDMPRSD